MKVIESGIVLRPQTKAFQSDMQRKSRQALADKILYKYGHQYNRELKRAPKRAPK